MLTFGKRLQLNPLSFLSLYTISSGQQLYQNPTCRKSPVNVDLWRDRMGGARLGSTLLSPCFRNFPSLPFFASSPSCLPGTWTTHPLPLCFLPSLFSLPPTRDSLAWLANCRGNPKSASIPYRIVLTGQGD